MKRRLVELLRCPACGGPLQLETVTEGAEQVRVPVNSPACRSFCTLHGETVDVAADGQPDCQTCYGRDVIEALLFCDACSHVAPVVNGIPRLAGAATATGAAALARHRALILRRRPDAPVVDRARPATFDRRTHDSFGLQWARLKDGDRTWFKQDETERLREFPAGMNVPAEALKGRLLLDAGCGNGRLTAAMSGLGLEVVGMDLSDSVEGAERRRHDIAGDRSPFVHFVQGNVMEPPFARDSFDFVHSSGVLHHTPDTEHALRALVPLARQSGRVYVQLYRKRETWVGVPNRMIRALTSRLPVRLLYRLCELAVPAHTAVVRGIARLRGERSPLGSASRGERALSLFDNYSPRYQHRFTPSQVAAMFARAGLAKAADVTLLNERRHMVAFVGERQA